MGVVYISYICRSIATVVHCGVMIWAMSLRMEGRGHLLHLPPLCCSPNVWMRSSLQLGTLRQMDNISNKPPPRQPSGVRNCFLYSQCSETTQKDMLTLTIIHSNNLYNLNQLWHAKQNSII